MVICVHMHVFIEEMMFTLTSEKDGLVLWKERWLKSLLYLLTSVAVFEVGECISQTGRRAK